VQTEERFSFRVALYSSAQSLQGFIAMRGIQGDIDIPFNEIAEKMNFGLIVGTEIRYRRWGFLIDMAYADLRGRVLRLSSAHRRPLIDNFDTVYNKDADYEQRQLVSNVVLYYRFVDSSLIALEGYAGVRLNFLAAESTQYGQFVAYGEPPFPVVKLEAESSQRWIDPVVGARFQTAVGGRVFVRAAGDIGGFGVGSDFTWQASGLIGVNVTRNFSLSLGYCGIGIDYTNGGFRYDAIAHGPLFGAELRF
jgi:hypothetical protein